MIANRPTENVSCVSLFELGFENIGLAAAKKMDNFNEGFLCGHPIF